MTERGRAWRRAQWEAMKARARSFYGGISDERFVGLAATTPHPCSGPCCGNPRRWFGGDERITMQERRAKEAAADMLDDAA
jgi:hypothetical protein